MTRIKIAEKVHLEIEMPEQMNNETLKSVYEVVDALSKYFSKLDNFNGKKISKKDIEIVRDTPKKSNTKKSNKRVGRPKTFPNELIKEIMDMYSQGYKPAVISEHIGRKGKHTITKKQIKGIIDRNK